jgi:hypothetical protein
MQEMWSCSRITLELKRIDLDRGLYAENGF